MFLLHFCFTLSPSQPPDLSIETRIVTDHVFNPKKTCHYTTMKVLASGYTGRESRTGNYTCRGMHDLSKVSSVYKYAYGKKIW